MPRFLRLSLIIVYRAVHGLGRVGFGPNPDPTRRASGGRRRDPKPTAGVTQSSRFWVRVVFGSVRSVERVAGSCKLMSLDDAWW